MSNLFWLTDEQMARLEGTVICGRLRFCKGFLERLGSKQVAVICPACVRGACNRWP